LFTTRFSVMAHTSLHPDIIAYHLSLAADDRAIVEIIANEICNYLPEAENKIWHRHPVWFINNNPVVGYSKQKAGVRLMFWSGADFDEGALNVGGKKFKDASIFFQNASEVKTKDLSRWLQKSKTIQWDYKNIVKRKGRLERLP